MISLAAGEVDVADEVDAVAWSEFFLAVLTLVLTSVVAFRRFLPARTH